MVYFSRASLRTERSPSSRCTATTVSLTASTWSRVQKPITVPVRGNVSVSPWVMPMPPPTLTL